MVFIIRYLLNMIVFRFPNNTTKPRWAKFKTNNNLPLIICFEIIVYITYYHNDQIS